MRYKAVIFDLDGTILNTLDDLADSLNHVLEISGCRECTKEEVRLFVGNGIRKLVERAVFAGGKSDEALIEEVYKNMLKYYQEHCMDKTAPYDGIMEMLQSLKEDGYKLAVVSNKADSAVQKLCGIYFEGIFDSVVGERAGVKRKPSPDSVFETLRILGMEKADAVYIGDSEVDIQTAENAGIKCISVSWGFRKADFLKQNGASQIIGNPCEIREYI